SIGIVRAIKTAPIAVADPVSFNTCQASAVEYAPSPSAEIVCPDQSMAKGLVRSARVKASRAVRTLIRQVSFPSPPRLVSRREQAHRGQWRRPGASDPRAFLREGCNRCGVRGAQS